MIGNKCVNSFCGCSTNNDCNSTVNPLSKYCRAFSLIDPSNNTINSSALTSYCYECQTDLECYGGKICNVQGFC